MTTGDGSDLVAMVVQALVQTASHTVGAAGAALGREAVERVREALRQWPQWAQVVGRVEASPGDEQAQRDLALAVGQLLARDPGLTANLRARLSVAMTEPPPAAGAGPVVEAGGSNRMSGQFAMGAGNIVASGDVRTRTTHRHGSVGALIAVLVVVAVLIALGIHLNSGQPQRLGGAGGPLGAAPLTSVAQVQSVLPDLHAVPAGWRQDQAPTAGPPSDCHGDSVPAAEVELCSQAVGGGVASFRTDNASTRVTFRILSGSGPAWADKTYDLVSGHASGSSAEPVAVPAIGDRSSAYKDDNYTDVVIKAGSTVLEVSYRPQYPDSRDVDLVTRLARMFATRSQQAQSGQAPDAATQ